MRCHIFLRMLSQKKAAAPFTGSFYSHRHLPLFISNEVKKLKYRGKEYDYFLFTDEASLRTAIAEYMAFYFTERMQARFNGKTPAEVRAEALTADVPEQYPIPENKRIQKYKARYAA